jgi:hypothetical protein
VPSRTAASPELRDADEGFSIRYTAGPKNGLIIHVQSAAELQVLFTVPDGCSGVPPAFPPVLPGRSKSPTVRSPRTIPQASER